MRKSGLFDSNAGLTERVKNANSLKCKNIPFLFAVRGEKATECDTRRPKSVLRNFLTFDGGDNIMVYNEYNACYALIAGEKPVSDPVLKSAVSA